MLQLVKFLMHFVSIYIAVLVWLNYKNAYEYWTEQRLAQIKDIQAPILQSQVDKVQTAATQALGTLFLQLTVVDLGICLPLGTTGQVLPYGMNIIRLNNFFDQQSY